MIEYKRVFVGSSCNNGCAYCKYQGQRREERPLREIKAELEERNSPEGDSRGYDSVELIGGEPALRNDLAEIITYARNWNWRRIKMCTNGRAFSDWNWARTAIEAGVRIFEVKVNGHSPTIHEAVTGVKNSFWETISAIRNIRSIQVLDNRPFSAFVGVRTSMCRENYTTLEEVVRFSIPLGIDRITLSFDDLELSMGEAMPYIKNTIETSIFNKVWIMTEKVPLCLMDGYEHHVSETYLQQINADYEQHENCRKCVYQRICRGVTKDYLAVHGFDEFKTVYESRHVSDIGALKHA